MEEEEGTKIEKKEKKDERTIEVNYCVEHGEYETMKKHQPNKLTFAHTNNSHKNNKLEQIQNKKHQQPAHTTEQTHSMTINGVKLFQAWRRYLINAWIDDRIFWICDELTIVCHVIMCSLSLLVKTVYV